MLLRVMVGFHFYSEGIAKLRTDGQWTSKFFLRGAKGPLAPMFHEMLEDENGQLRLCIDLHDNEDGTTQWQVDTELTEALWFDFLDIATSHYDFNGQDLIKQIQSKQSEIDRQIESAKKGTETNVNLGELKMLRRDHEASIRDIREQSERAKLVYQEHVEELKYWLDVNGVEILAHFNSLDRVDGFERDGNNRKQIAVYVEAIRDQVDSIESDRLGKLNGWYAEVESIWDSYENEINNLAVGPQLEEGRLAIHRPHDQPTSSLKLIDQFIPWFDTIVGILLILGLFTRFASLSAALFLGSVILSQPFWIPDAKPTYYESVELFALLVLFATCAGRYAGLDFFFSQRSQETAAEVNE